MRSGLLALLGLVVLHRPDVGGARPPINVIIPAYNEEEVIVETLESIDSAASRYAGPVRIILTDDGSTDRTRELAEAAIAAFVAATGTIIDGQHKGKSAALNLALARADADIVVRIDADTLIAEDTLVYLPRWFRDGQHRHRRSTHVAALGTHARIHRMRLFEELRIFGLNHRVLQTV